MTATHKCPGQCGTSVPNRLFACRRCWTRLPRPLQNPIYETVGLSLTSPARAAAVAAAVEWFAEHGATP